MNKKVNLSNLLILEVIALSAYYVFGKFQDKYFGIALVGLVALHSLFNGMVEEGKAKKVMYNLGFIFLVILGTMIYFNL